MIPPFSKIQGLCPRRTSHSKHTPFLDNLLTSVKPPNVKTQSFSPSICHMYRIGLE